MVEAIANSVEDRLIDGLSFKLRPGASYVTDRRSVTFHPRGSNIYKPKAVPNSFNSISPEVIGWTLAPSAFLILSTTSNHKHQSSTCALLVLHEVFSDACASSQEVKSLKLSTNTIAFTR